MLVIDNVWVEIESKPILRGVDFQIQPAEIFCLLGPSGCGKSTLLRTIAGLESVKSGSIIYGGWNINSTPTSQRGFGLMFQDYALFPHMTVAENVGFGLKMAKWSRQRARARVEEVLSLVGMETFADRSVDTLSGGQQQRVALARSLAPNPRLLMLDEPLASLDAGLSRRLRAEIRQLIKRLDLTVIYVTHNQQEAFSIADRIGIMNAGRIVEIGTAEALYHHPKNTFTAQFLGFETMLSIIRSENGQAITEIGAFDVTPGSEFVFIHPDGVRVESSESSGTILVQVTERSFQGQHYDLRAMFKSHIELVFSLESTADKIPKVGDQIFISFIEDYVYGLA